MSRPEPDADRDGRVPPDLRAKIERYDDDPDVCTIFDAATPRRVPTTWISAEEGAYVSLEAWR